jgi:hypothetical protein
MLGPQRRPRGTRPHPPGRYSLVNACGPKAVNCIDTEKELSMLVAETETP